MYKVTQRPRDIPIEIFKTPTGRGRGWGVRAKCDISKGKFIGIYTGELLYSQDRESRSDSDIGSSQGSVEDDYLLALDWDGADSWTVSSLRAGNWSRFINHSCEPNTRAYSVTCGELTFNQEELLYAAYVATCDIPAYTELTLDYRPSSWASSASEGRKKCRCGARQCRGYI